ncbi:MAG: YfiR family protein [Bryobacteraceae bacterium]|nr:YfiR family protein [Bryobacteraceae bacterium]
MDLLRRSIDRRVAAALALRLVLAPVVLCSSTVLGAETASEREVKAAMLYNFTKFVEWPSGALGESGAPVTICVAGRDPFGPALEQAVADRTAYGRPIRIAKASRVEELKGCHILYVSISERKYLSETLEAIAQPGVLTVSDIEDFTHQGGIVGFVLRDSKVRFEVNLDAAEKARLKISARLLKLATEIHHSGSGGRN